nr:alpha/beta fold hydrolase [Cupriavidus plantarum]
MNRIAAACALAAAIAVTDAAQAATVSYQTVAIDGVNIAYRESGDQAKPAILLLHGVPSSSRMYDALMRRLGDKYHLVAPDYPGFGNSDAPDPATFSYTFDNLSKVMQAFTDTLGLQRYVLFMQDYGAPVGMRMAEARPQAVRALVFQNGNVYEAGLGAMWSQRKAFWTDRASHEGEVVRVHQSVAATRAPYWQRPQCRGLRSGFVDGRVRLSESAGPGAHSGRPDLRLSIQHCGVPALAGMAAKAATPYPRGLGQARPGVYGAWRRGIPA